MFRKLKDIAQTIEVLNNVQLPDMDIQQIVFDSRKAIEGTIFVAIKGSTTDGHQYISQVIEQGCKVVVVNENQNLPDAITQIVVADTSSALATLAANFYNNPSHQLKLIGITGTNGKTTTTTLLHKLFNELGHKAGLLSTVVNKIGNEIIPSTHTTPDPVSLNELLSKMVESGCEYCFMEVSSHAIHQQRIGALRFTGGAFTNITHDHLDYHKTFKEYLEVKQAFFTGLPKDAFALTNIDDKNGLVMLQNMKAKKYTYALKAMADYKAKVIENQFSGLVLQINQKEVWTKLIGDFNAYNLLVVYGIADLLGQDTDEVLRIISTLESVEGRFQYLVSEGGITAIVDYAHTPDALENVLKTIHNIRTRNEQVLTVVGCGGDRDKEKRPKMASIACEWSEKVILTSDNPRSEEPQTILNEMMEGVEPQHFKKSMSILDRKEAIKTAINLSTKGDIILIAGKGHEKYQEIKGVKHDFDDLAITKDLFIKLEK